jgi:hypothetical protein
LRDLIVSTHFEEQLERFVDLYLQQFHSTVGADAAKQQGHGQDRDRVLPREERDQDAGATPENAGRGERRPRPQYGKPVGKRVRPDVRGKVRGSRPARINPFFTAAAAVSPI